MVLTGLVWKGIQAGPYWFRYCLRAGLWYMLTFTKMKAVVYKRYEAPDVQEFKDIPKPIVKQIFGRKVRQQGFPVTIQLRLNEHTGYRCG